MTGTLLPLLTSYVDGAWCHGATEMPVTNPARPSEVVAICSQADAALAADAVGAAHASAATWAGTVAPERAEILRRAADLLEVRSEAIGRDLTCEEGKTLDESIRETRLAAKILRYNAAQAFDPEGETYPSHDASVLLFTRQDPLGVVSVITPWNFPISIPAWKIAPALAFGNTVVWKPAEIVPTTAVRLVEALADAGLPAGVLNLVLGRGSVIGGTLVERREVAAVTFTGSNDIGLGIQEAATRLGKRVQLELGGKNPAVVLGDADLDLAAEQISIGAFGATGQKCTATSRVIVEKSVADDLVDRLRARAEAWIVGDPLRPETTMGPLASAAQLASVAGHVEDAIGTGARPVTGGARWGGEPCAGYFVPPTILADVRADDPVVREEVFGPVATVLTASDYDEAVALANDTPFGLSASIFTNQLRKALDFTRQVRAGIVKINQGTSGTEYHVPFGGLKGSGVGPREQGKAARTFFTESKTVYLGTGPAA